MKTRFDRAARRLLLLGAGLLLAAGLLGTASAKDLTVSLAPAADPEHNTPFQVDVTVGNDASGATGAPVEIQLYIDGNASGPLLNIGAMNSNTTAATSTNLTAPCGTHTLSATVDPNDAVAESNETNNNFSMVIVVQPVVNFTHAITGDPGEYTLTLTAATQGCAALDYSWDLDGTVKTGSPVDYTPIAGDHLVVLTVSSPGDPAIDNSATQVITIPNRAPDVSTTLIAPSTTVREPIALQIQYGDIDGWVAEFLVDFGDGNTTDEILDALVYEYETPGNYTITVTVTDNLGAETQVTVQIEVRNLLPIARIASFLAGNAGSPIRFNGSLSSDPDGGTLTFAWDFGDGETGTGATTQHTYATDGTYLATMTVTDEHGGSASAEISVQVVAGGDSGGGLFVAIGLIGFVAVLLAGYYLLVVERKKKAGEGDGPTGSEGASDGDGKGGDSKPGVPDIPAYGGSGEGAKKP